MEEDFDHRFLCNIEKATPGLAFTLFDSTVETVKISFEPGNKPPDISKKANTVQKESRILIEFDEDFSLKDLFFELPTDIRRETDIESITGFKNNTAIFHSRFFSEHEKSTLTTINLDNCQLSLEEILTELADLRNQLTEFSNEDLKATVIPTGPITDWESDGKEIGITESDLWISERKKHQLIPLQFVESFQIDKEEKTIELGYKRYFRIRFFIRKLLKWRKLKIPPANLPFEEKKQIQVFQNFMKYFIATYHEGKIPTEPQAYPNSAT